MTSRRRVSLLLTRVSFRVGRGVKPTRGTHKFLQLTLLRKRTTRLCRLILNSGRRLVLILTVFPGGFLIRVKWGKFRFRWTIFISPRLLWAVCRLRRVGIACSPRVKFCLELQADGYLLPNSWFSFRFSERRKNTPSSLPPRRRQWVPFQLPLLFLVVNPRSCRPSQFRL